MSEALNSILDFPKENLCDKLWDFGGDMPALKSDLRSIILSTANKNLSKFGLQMSGCHLYGGSASYQYTDVSDVDTGIFVHWDDESEAKIDRVKKYFSSIEIMYDTHPVHFYIKDPADTWEVAESIYDVMSDKWILPPLVLPDGFDPDSYFSDKIEVAKIEADKLDAMFGSLNREYKLLKDSKESLPTAKNAKVVENRISQQKRNMRSLLVGIVHEYRSLKKSRQEMHEEIGKRQGSEPKDRMARFQQPEITWKYLERNGYLTKMRKIKDALEV